MTKRPFRRATRAGLVLVLGGATVVAGCGGAPVLANDPLAFPSPPLPTARPSRPLDPIAIELPRDDGPHDRLTEWWYYTGHLRSTADGHRYGFEAVVFRAERGGAQVAWASHLALTDENGQVFTYAQRSEIGPQADHSPRGAGSAPSGFDLQVTGLNPELIAKGAPPIATPWRLAGSNGTDRIEAALSPAEAKASGRSFGLALDLHSTKGPALHDVDGFVDFGPAGSSYYYSRTRTATTGTLTVDGARLPVEGIAWFDHQWGDFISIGSGGWNWFAINLDDGRYITVSQVIDPHANALLTYGTLVTADGNVIPLDGNGIGLQTTGMQTWTSPHTGLTWARHWTVFVNQFQYELEATVQDQELDTRATTGVVYWEGSHRVSTFTDVGQGPLGDAYVEMTRYDAFPN